MNSIDVHALLYLEGEITNINTLFSDYCIIIKPNLAFDDCRAVLSYPNKYYQNGIRVKNGLIYLTVDITTLTILCQGVLDGIIDDTTVFQIEGILHHYKTIHAFHCIKFGCLICKKNSYVLNFDVNKTSGFAA